MARKRTTLNSSPDRLLCRREAAHILGVSVRTIPNLTTAGRLPVVRIMGAVRYRLSDLQRLMREGEGHRPIDPAQPELLSRPGRRAGQDLARETML